MTDIPQLPDTKKSFWERPEGWAGALFLGLGALAFVYFSSTIMSMLATTLGALTLLGIVGAVVYMALDPKVRNIVWALYQMICKKATGMIIEMDPIAIINGYIEKLEKNRSYMNDQISKLRQQMGSLDRLIKTNEATRQQSLQLMNVAKQQANQGQFMLKSRAAGRLENSNVNLKQLYTKLEVVYRVLTKMYENTGIVLEDTKDEVKTRTIEYNAIKTSSNAFRSAMAVINGDSDKKAIFDQTMEYMADDIGARVGEMEHFMDISKGFMDGIDLQNGVFEQQGLKMLEDWEKQGAGLLLPADQKQQLLAAANDDNNDVNLDEDASNTVKVGKGHKYV